jgi:hypothetical protein
MSVQEIKAQLLGLPRREQDEVIAFLFQARHAEDENYQRDVTRRVEDRNPAHWLTPDEFERRLDQREPRDRRSSR